MNIPRLKYNLWFDIDSVHITAPTPYQLSVK